MSVKGTFFGVVFEGKAKECQVLSLVGHPGCSGCFSRRSKKSLLGSRISLASDRAGSPEWGLTCPPGGLVALKTDIVAHGNNEQTQLGGPHVYTPVAKRKTSCTREGGLLGHATCCFTSFPAHLPACYILRSTLMEPREHCSRIRR